MVLAGADPGIQAASGDESESDLDLEWAGAVAPNASIVFVTASSTSGNGALDAITYVIENTVAPILSNSYGVCEADLTTAEVNTLSNQFAQANAEGITIVSASGDWGAAGCDSGKIATHGLAVDFPSSLVSVTGVAGTRFNDGTGSYWSSPNASGGGSAISYIPEIVCNEGNLSASGGAPAN
jgi:subtilase family serine protease